MSLFACQYIDYTGEIRDGIFHEHEVTSVGLPSIHIIASPQQKMTPDIKAWMYIKGSIYPYALTETREAFFERTGIKSNLQIEFKFIARDTVWDGKLRVREIKSIVGADDEELGRRAPKLATVSDDARVKAYLFAEDEKIYPILETVGEFARRHKQVLGL